MLAGLTSLPLCHRRGMDGAERLSARSLAWRVGTEEAAAKRPHTPGQTRQHTQTRREEAAYTDAGQTRQLTAAARSLAWRYL
jgi:hypothetical protein